MSFTNGHPSQSAGNSMQDPRLYNSNYYRTPVMVPSVPPPPIMPSVPMQFSFDLSVPAPLVISNKTEDEIFIDNWLISIGKKQNSVINPKQQQKPKAYLSIYIAKEGLKKCLEITAKLEATQKILTENVSTMNTENWKMHTVEIGTLKDELSLLMAQFKNPAAIKSLKYNISQRAKKRATQKRRRAENKLQKVKEKEDTLTQHKKIDLWLTTMKEQAERAKAEEAMKRDADCVLAEVTKKKTEARKQLSLVASLIKLRMVRETAAKARGEKIPAEDNAAFTKTTETLVKLWENSSKAYAQEEQQLKSMLQKNADADNKQSLENKQKEIIQQWDEVLFGPRYEPSQLYWALTSAQRDLEKFIAIRKSWDTFLTTCKKKGTPIPIGWVIPESNPSLEWSQYKQI